MVAKKKKGNIKLESSDEQLLITREEQEQYEINARDAALALSGSAVWRGAKSESKDGEYDPCGLDVVLDAVFGEEIGFCKLPLEERLKREQ